MFYCAVIFSAAPINLTERTCASLISAS